MAFDASPFVFIQFFAVTLAVGVCSSIALVRYLLWRRTATARAVAGCCGSCGSSLGFTATHNVTGIPVCRSCANELRRRLAGWMLGASVAISALLLISTTAFVADIIIDGGPAWRWWTKNSRMWVVIIPAVTVVATAATAIGLVRLVNKLAAAREMARLRNRSDLSLLGRVLASFELPTQPTTTVSSRSAEDER